MDKPSPPLDLITCEECLYYDAINDEQGNCRRFAPRPSHTLDQTQTAEWPIVRVYDACGDARSIHS